MRISFKIPDKKTLLILSGSLLLIPILVIVFWISGIIFTYTGSIPVGFYRMVPMGSIQRGDYISFCLPDKIANLGLERAYINPGSCANGSEELLKEVIAVAGDRVEVSDSAIRVNYQNLALSYFAPTAVVDKDHLPVHRFIKNGTCIAKGYWVYGYGNPRYSWDSRYYGEIPRTNIKHRLIPLWQF